MVGVVDSTTAEHACDLLWQAGAAAIEERTSTDGRVELRAAPANGDGAALLDALGHTDDHFAWTLETVATPPTPSWPAHAGPVQIGDQLVIVAAPSLPQQHHHDGALEVVIDAGDAFGWGGHSSTRLALELVVELDLTGSRVLDAGCGSGVLAVVAAMRGAAHVTAVDVDPAATAATEANARRNGVALDTRLTDLAEPSSAGTLDAPFDVVVANLLVDHLRSIGTLLVASTRIGGSLVISGVLSTQLDELTSRGAVFGHGSLELARCREHDGWSAARFVRHG